MTLMPVDEARRRLLDRVAPTERTEVVRLSCAPRRILAADIYACRTQPAFNASAMDGWAVRAADVTSPFRSLRPVGEAAAGRALDRPIGTRETARIFTGAPLPAGADAILIQENTRLDAEGHVMPLESVSPGQHVRIAGIDFAEGDLLLRAGRQLNPGAIALAASGGHAELPVRLRPRVAILATGDELVPPGTPVGPAQIVASNSYGVAAIVSNAGGEVLDLGIAPDDETAIGEKFDAALADEADVLVTIGGASVGDHDLVAPVLQSRGVDFSFWKVAMRPGKPLMAGQLHRLKVLGLPGNPASAMVAALLFLRPLVERLAGRESSLEYRTGVLSTDMPGNGSRTDFIRATRSLDRNGNVALTPLPLQDSSLLSIYAAAEALLVREPFAEPASAGTPCRYVEIE